MNGASHPYGNDTKTEPRRFPVAADLAMTIGGSVLRLPTGFVTLDTATRGGLMARRLIAIAGPPGAGKTTLTIDIAHRAVRAGFHVAILCHDEARETCMIRWGQLEGLTRENLESGSTEARTYLADALRSQPIFFADGDEDEATVEDVAGELLRRAGEAPSLLVVDSIQTVRAAGTLGAPSPREAVNATVAALKLASKKSMVIATSEVGRGWYRSRSERIDPLAAFKESGGIEYGIALGLVMLGVEGETGVADVFTAKNRIGTARPIFRLRQDFARASFEEVERPATTAGDRPTAGETRAARHEVIKGEVMDLLVTVRDLASIDAIGLRLRRNVPDVRLAVQELVARAIVVKHKPIGVRGASFRLASDVRDEPPAESEVST